MRFDDVDFQQEIDWILPLRQFFEVHSVHMGELFIEKEGKKRAHSLWTRTLVGYKRYMNNKDAAMKFENSWDNATKAESYAKLEFPNTYYLAYRDLPQTFKKHVKGNEAIDFGCGTGRSTRFLKSLGYNVIGIDISQDMLNKAKEFDNKGDYRRVTDGNYSHLGLMKYDLVQSIFTFDNIPGKENRINILTKLGELLKSDGRLVCLDSNSEMYTNQWASFSTKEFPENRNAKTGDIVKVIVNDLDDKTPVNDIYWTMEDYKDIFAAAEYVLEAIYSPKGKEDEPFNWVSEKEIAPWIIYVLRKNIKTV